MEDALKTLSYEYKLQLVRHMKTTVGSYAEHAEWASKNFNQHITPRDCIMLIWSFDDSQSEDEMINKTGVEALTDRQIRLLTSHMKRYEDDTWEQHVKWFSAIFGKTLTEKDCTDLYVKSLCQEHYEKKHTEQYAGFC